MNNLLAAALSGDREAQKYFEEKYNFRESKIEFEANEHRRLDDKDRFRDAMCTLRSFL